MEARERGLDALFNSEGMVKRDTSIGYEAYETCPIMKKYYDLRCGGGAAAAALACRTIDRKSPLERRPSQLWS